MVDGPLLQGRWRLGAPLGRGSQGQTFLAVEVARRQEVVIKRVQLGAGWKSFELHERETKVLGQLRHAGIPRLHAAFEEPAGTFNLVMQRMPGSDLRALVGKQRLSELELKDILVRALEILDYLATRTPPVVHRDIKPSNLLVTTAGGEPDVVKLIDFGIARDRGRDHTLTAADMVVGTPAYMAPEQATGGELTPAADVYALAATCYFALTGQPLFDGATPEQLLAAQLHDPPARLAARAAVPDDLDALIMRALAKQPAHRFADAAAFSAALAQTSLIGQWRPRRADAAPRAAAPTDLADATVPLPAQPMP